MASSSNKVIALHHCRGSTACTQTGGDENRGVPTNLIADEIAGILSGGSTPAPSPATPPPTAPPTFACSGGTALFTLDLVNDFYGGETTWRLTNTASGSVLLSGGPYGQDEVVFDDICLSTTGCYTFTIFDSFGDGICCEYGIGSWTITFNGATVGSGGTFTSSESATFGSNCPATPSPTPAPGPSPTPSPDDDGPGGVSNFNNRMIL